MATKNKLHDEQTTAAAERLRNIVKEVRGGMTQRDTEEFLKQIEDVAKDLENMGKSQEEIAQEAEDKGEPDPNKSPAELVKQTIEESKAKDAKDPKSAPTPGKPAPLEDLGKPAVTSQSSTTKRDAVEVTAKKADSDIKAISKN